MHKMRHNLCRIRWFSTSKKIVLEHKISRTYYQNTRIWVLNFSWKRDWMVNSQVIPLAGQDFPFQPEEFYYKWTNSKPILAEKIWNFLNEFISKSDRFDLDPSCLATIILARIFWIQSVIFKNMSLILYRKKWTRWSKHQRALHEFRHFSKHTVVPKQAYLT